MATTLLHGRKWAILALVAALATAGALAGTATFAPAPAQAAAKPLKKGSKGPRVRKAQRWLGVRADGIFGSGTKRAVKRFQRRHGLTADGVVGPATWAALRRAAHSRRTSSRRTAAAAARPSAAACGCSSAGSGSPSTASSAPARSAPSRPSSAATASRPTASSARPPGRALGHASITTVLKRSHRGSPRRPGGLPIRVRRIIAAGNRIADKPYKYGGGHGQWNDSGYDCSGSVSYALHGAGYLSSALTSGGFMSWGSPGKGRWVTIYAAPGHVYMVVNGRRFDTTGRSESGTRWQASDRSSAGYVVRHPPGL